MSKVGTMPSAVISLYQSVRAFSLLTMNAFAGLACLLTFAIVVILNIPVFIFRQFVVLLAKYARPDLGRVLNPLSNVLSGDLIVSDKPPRSNLIILAPNDGNIPIAPFEELVLAKWIHARTSDGKLKYPQFSQFPVSWWGFSFWKTDPNFNIKSHVHFHQDPDGAPSTDKELNALVEDLLNAPHQPRHSPWEIHVLQDYYNPKLHPGGMSVFIYNGHHSLADGHSLLMACTGELYGKEEEHPGPEVRTRKRSFFNWLSSAVTLLFTGSIEFAQLLWEVSKDGIWKIRDEQKAWHQFYATSELIPLDNLKLIKNACGVSFTSVLLSGISAAIHKNLVSKRGAETSQFQIIDKEVSTMQCFSVLPLPPKTRSERLTNHVTGAVFGIPTGQFRNSLDRLLECDRSLEEKKKSVIPALAALYAMFLGSHFRWLQRFFIRRCTVPIGLTNFICTGEEFSGRLLGRRGLLNNFAAGTHPGATGVGFMVSSCCGHVSIGVTAEKGLLSREEVEDLVKSVEEEIATLHSISKAKENLRKVEQRKRSH